MSYLSPPGGYGWGHTVHPPRLGGGQCSKKYSTFKKKLRRHTPHTAAINCVRPSHAAAHLVGLRPSVMDGHTALSAGHPIPGLAVRTPLQNVMPGLTCPGQLTEYPTTRAEKCPVNQAVQLSGFQIQIQIQIR